MLAFSMVSQDYKSLLFSVLFFLFLWIYPMR